MEKVKVDLEKQFKFPKLGLNYKHIKFTTRKIMKIRHGDWLKVYQLGMVCVLGRCE
jgi:hypothetical protein